jgi:DNA repair exonuclease SbcCD ATPase subunit
MKKLEFKYLSAQNFVCFGSEGIEIDFTKKDPVVLVCGDNLDVFEDEERVASNGIGKSSIADVLVFSLFGKTAKNPKKIKLSDLVHNKNKHDGLRTEVRWDNYRVVRTYKKSQKVNLYEWEDDSWKDISPGGVAPTQQLIEDKLGMTFESFVNVVIFTDNNSGTFLESDAESKRKIIDNLLALYRFRLLHQVSSEFRKDAKLNVKNIAILYQQMTDTLETLKNRIQGLENKQNEWKKEKQTEINNIEKQLVKIREELERGSDQGEALSRYELAQTKIKELSAKTFDLTNKDKLVDNTTKQINQLEENAKINKNKISLEIQGHQHSLQSIQNIIKEKQRSINSLLNLKDGTKCTTCMGIISKENYAKAVENLRNEIQEQETSAEKENNFIANLKKQLSEEESSIKKYNQNLNLCKQKSLEINKKIFSIRKEISDLANISKPETGVNEALLLQKISQLKDQIESKKVEASGPTPYDDILESAINDIDKQRKLCKQKEDELSEAEESIGYYEFMVKAFDIEIRRFVIDDILPGLNNKISYWLQFLMEGKIRIKFDNQMEEHIDRNPPDGDPFVYYVMSGGERRRINLAVSQAFAYIMMLSSGCSPSIVFLDEVTTNVDPVGVEGIYRMIQELSNGKQVFVTTHDQGLLEKLNGCDKIVLQKKDGFTKII